MMFSVVVPLFNKVSSISDTIMSVIGQAFDDFELIVVDDGSTDGSADVVSSYEDVRIHLVRKDNGGVCSARNAGIVSAHNDYVAFLDADDLWDKDYLLEQKKMIEDFPEAAMWGINFAETRRGRPVRHVNTGLPSGYRGIVADYFNMPETTGRVSDLFCSSSVVIRKDVFANTGLFDERLKFSEDLDMWWRIIADYPVAFYDKEMVFYRFDAENRAMTRKREFRYWLPYYADKFSRYKGNDPFYSFVQRWCAVNIKECYFHDREQRADAKDAATRLDFSVLPGKYLLFFNTPYLIGKTIYLLGELKNRIECYL